MGIVPSSLDDDRTEIVMQSRITTVTMEVYDDQPFASIAESYVKAGHAPPEGITLMWCDVKINATDTPESLGIRSGDIIHVTW